MEKDTDEWLLAVTIDDIHTGMNELYTDLQRAEKMVAPARRARGTTIRLTKLFKDFRKLSCKLGLK